MGQNENCPTKVCPRYEIIFLSLKLGFSTSYAALGLIHDLNPTAAGGSEPIEVRSRTEDRQIASTPLESPPPIRKGFGKIIRDDAGNVLRIELPEDDNETLAEKRQDEGLSEPEVDGAVLKPWVTDLGCCEKIKLSSGDRNVVQGEDSIIMISVTYSVWPYGAEFI